MSIRKITFNWEFNVGTILMLTAQCITLVAFTAVLYYRFKGVERTVAEHSVKLESIGRKVDIITTIVDERTSPRRPTSIKPLATAPQP